MGIPTQACGSLFLSFLLYLSWVENKLLERRILVDHLQDNKAWILTNEYIYLFLSSTCECVMFFWLLGNWYAYPIPRILGIERFWLQLGTPGTFLVRELLKSWEPISDIWSTTNKAVIWLLLWGKWYLQEDCMVISWYLLSYYLILKLAEQVHSKSAALEWKWFKISCEFYFHILRFF